MQKYFVIYWCKSMSFGQSMYNGSFIDVIHLEIFNHFIKKSINKKMVQQLKHKVILLL